MRAFIGIALPPAVRSSLAMLQQQLAESRADVKWVEEPNLHVTMRFLGEIDEAQRENVEQLLRRIASALPLFDLGLSRIGAFPSLSAPRVVWVGVEPGQEELGRILGELERELRTRAFPGEDRTFTAHITLGRVRSNRHLSQLIRLLKAVEWHASPPWRATSVTLYQSTLSSAGPRYTVLADAAFLNSPTNEPSH